MVLLILGLTTAINSHRQEIQAYVSVMQQKQQQKTNFYREITTCNRQKLPFPQNRFTAIASALASLEDFNEVNE